MSASPNTCSSSSAKRRKGNDGTVVGILSSWLGYFTSRRDDDAQHMFAQNQQMMERTEKLMYKMEGKLESLEERRNEQTMERMEKLMHKVEEKLESLEDRDNNEEREGTEEECSSEGGSGRCEENMEEFNESGDDRYASKGRSTLHAYKEMVAKNRNDWNYSAEDLTFLDMDTSLGEFAALNIHDVFKSIKNCTIKLRRGEYHHEGIVSDAERDEIEHLQGVLLGPCDYNIDDYSHHFLEPIRYISKLGPHWEEFAQALNDFDLILDVMPDDTESCFQISSIELPATILTMIVKSLSGKRFRHYRFIRNDFRTHGIRALIDLMDSNPELRSLTLSSNGIDHDDIVDFFRAIGRHSTLTKVNLDCCFEGYGIHSHLCGLILLNRLVEISMRNDDLTFGAEQRQVLVESLASNTTLKRLDLRENYFVDEDAAAYASALETNKTLKYLLLAGNAFTDYVADECFGVALMSNNTLEYLNLQDRYETTTVTILSRALFHKTSLNSASSSNHNCYVDCSPYQGRNKQGDPMGNRQRKIYNVLATRHETMSNVQHFDDIGINLLPKILSAVQLYANAEEYSGFYLLNSEIPGLSIVYELMRKWDKALSIYKTLGNSDN